MSCCSVVEPCNWTLTGARVARPTTLTGHALSDAKLVTAHIAYSGNVRCPSSFARLQLWRGATLHSVPVCKANVDGALWGWANPQSARTILSCSTSSSWYGPNQSDFKDNEHAESEDIDNCLQISLVSVWYWKAAADRWSLFEICDPQPVNAGTLLDSLILISILIYYLGWCFFQIMKWLLCRNAADSLTIVMFLSQLNLYAIIVIDAFLDSWYYEVISDQEQSSLHQECRRHITNIHCSTLLLPRCSLRCAHCPPRPSPPPPLTPPTPTPPFPTADPSFVSRQMNGQDDT
jgi:hypothetical protein